MTPECEILSSFLKLGFQLLPQIRWPISLHQLQVYALSEFYVGYTMHEVWGGLYGAFLNPSLQMYWLSPWYFYFSFIGLLVSSMLVSHNTSRLELSTYLSSMKFFILLRDTITFGFPFHILLNLSEIVDQLLVLPPFCRCIAWWHLQHGDSKILWWVTGPGIWESQWERHSYKKALHWRTALLRS